MFFNRLKIWFLNYGAGKYQNSILDHLSIKEGAYIADIGSGGGVFTLAMAERAGEYGRIYAVDINTKNLLHIGKTAIKTGLAERIVLTPAETNNCNLASSVCDLAFSCHSFHHINEPEKYFEKVAEALKPEGQLAVIDYDGTIGFPKTIGHFTRPDRIKAVLEDTGFTLMRSYDFLPGQSFQIFRKAG